jgi:outer membrane protein
LILAACAMMAFGAGARGARAQSTTPTTAAAGAPLKIGVVDVEAITRRSTSVQAAINRAEQSVQAEQEKINARMEELTRLRQNLTAQRSVLTAAEIDAQETKLRQLRDEVEDMTYQVNKKIDNIKIDIMDPEVNRIMVTVGEVAKREGYDLVMRSEAVLFHSEKTDLTPLVIQALDRAAPAATATPPARPAESAGATPATARRAASKPQLPH